MIVAHDLSDRRMGGGRGSELRLLGGVSVSIVFVCHFFFFQAEDGIRDLTVTGVQTCALPISRFTPGINFDNSGTNNISIRGISGSGGAGTTGIYLDDTPIQMRALAFNPDEALRSEERRVGKECRSRWSPYH